MADLKSFVESQMKQKKASESVDWSKRRDKWVTELRKLFDSVEASLQHAEFPSDQITRTTHTLHEETLGRYEAPGLLVKLPAGGRVTFTPIASVIVGGYGRVDVDGPARNSIKVIALDAEQNRAEDDKTPSYEREWNWHVFPAVGLRQSFRLDEQGLAQLLAIATAPR